MDQENQTLQGSYTVKQGENLSLIAVKFGFADHQYIYNHPSNADLKLRRKCPDVLHPGDRVAIPKLRPKAESCATDQIHKFVVRIPHKTLRIALRNAKDEPLSGLPYALTIEAAPALGHLRASDRKTYRGEVDSDGILQCEVPVNAGQGTLELPGVIWELRLNELNPPCDTPDDGLSGNQARLENLGFNPGPVDGQDGPRTRAAVRRFQQKYPPLKVDGICGPSTRRKLVEIHGS